MTEEFAKSRAWIELDRENLRHNVGVLRARLPAGCGLMPAVKANAYGHGAVLIARELNAMGVGAFCVATATEGAELRQNGVRGTILVLGCTLPGQFPLLERYALEQTVADLGHARLLNGCGSPLRVHIGIDTGMHRLGEDWREPESVRQIFRMENLRVEGIYTHLCADDTDEPRGRAFTREQGRRFFELLARLRERGLSCPKAHILNSFGLLRYPELGGDYARVGLALYGALGSRAEAEAHGLRPVLSLKARVAAVKALAPGEGAGYGLEFTAKRETKIAVLTIGYADGLPRALSCGAGNVLLHGRAAPIAGRVCMDQTLVDVTGLPAVRAGDTAVVIGPSGARSIHVCELAEQAQTIPNEIFSRLGPRLERILAGE